MERVSRRVSFGGGDVIDDKRSFVCEGGSKCEHDSLTHTSVNASPGTSARFEVSVREIG